MTIAAFLPPRLLDHVQHVFTDEPEILIATSWEELDAFIRRKPVAVAIIDPLVDGTVNVDAVAGLLKRYPSLPLVAYVSLTAPAFAAVAQLGRAGLQDVVLHHFDDAPDRFRRRIEQIKGNPLAHKVTQAIAHSLADVPREVAATIERMFDQPHRYMSALDLAIEAGIPIVRMYRNLTLAGLGSPKRLLIAAKALRGFGYLRDPGYSVLDVSFKLGYRSSRIFSEHTVSVYGLTPARMRARLTDERAVESVLTWLRVPGEPAEAAGDRRHRRSRRHTGEHH